MKQLKPVVFYLIGLATLYPLRHISIRVPWHDTGWDGRVCAKPRLNGACLKLNVLVKSGMMQPKKLWLGNPWSICLKRSGPAV